MRDRDVPVPGAARRRPDQPQRPANQAPHRPHLAVGRTDHPSMAADPRRVHLNQSHSLSQRPETPTPAGGTGANPTRQSGPQPTSEAEITTPQALSTPPSRLSNQRGKSRLAIAHIPYYRNSTFE